MHLLIAWFSRSGYTEQLALALGEQLRSRGHRVAFEKICATKVVDKWRLTLPLLSTLPILPAYLMHAGFRRWWLQHYRQARQPIQPLSHPDVSRFDLVCVGGPKWLYLSYPLAQYLQQVQGLADKPVGAFATFCGPPLAVFELEMLFTPLRRCIESRHANWRAALALSSHHHEFFFFNEMEWVFRLISRLVFRRPLRTFTLQSEWGQQELRRFCDSLEEIGRPTSEMARIT